MGRGYGGKTNVFNISMDSYSFPYSLGLVLTGSYAYELFGIPFFRASGMFHEPSTAVFMTVPALILTFNSIYFSKKWQRRTLLAIQFCFIAVSISLSIIFSLLATYILYNILVFFKKSLFRVKLIKVFSFAVIISGFGLLGFYSFNIPAQRGLTRNILLSKLSTDYLTILLGILYNSKYLFTYIYLLTVSLSCAFIARKMNNNPLMSFSLIIIGFLIMSLKGYFYHILISPGFFVLFFLMLKNLSRSVSYPQQSSIGLYHNEKHGSQKNSMITR